MHAPVPMVRFAVEVVPMVDSNAKELRWRRIGDHATARIDFAGTDLLRLTYRPTDWAGRSSTGTLVAHDIVVIRGCTNRSSHRRVTSKMAHRLP